MKIVGGSFGIKGKAKIENGILIVAGNAYPASQIKSASASVEKERKFGFVGFILGALLLSVVLGMLLNVLGVILAIIIATVGSFYSKKMNFVDVTFGDGKNVRIQCSGGEVKKLLRLQS